ncbi:MAG: magnesium and cobalt exporter, family [Actinomycetota bacterium]|nr:magnesium and cobalt exporter, family [Actinomycetota bacterium]
MIVAIDIAIVLALILIEAVFVATEIALVSLRDSQVKGLANKGRRGAAVARLTADPNRFLAGVQIGVTITSLLSSAFGAVTLSEAAASGLRDLGMSRRAAGVLGFLLVTLAISFVTLVVGELVPKRLALQRAEQAAQLAAPTLDQFARLMRPVIWLLSASTNVMVRLLGGDPSATRESISEEELRGLVATHESLGGDERRLINEVFAAGDRRLREVLVPRTEVEFLDASTSVAQALRSVASGPHSRYPVVRGSHDDVVGFVHIRDLVTKFADGDPRSERVGDLARPVMMLPDGKNVLAALSEMRREHQHLAIVVDEYGGTAGIVTLEDLVEEVVGDIRDEYDIGTAGPHRLRGGDVVVDGLLNIDDFAEQTGVELPEGPYETVAGFLMAELGHLPKIGESVEVEGHRLTVVELDGRRVAKVRVSAPAPDMDPATQGRLGE